MRVSLRAGWRGGQPCSRSRADRGRTAEADGKQAVRLTEARDGWSRAGEAHSRTLCTSKRHREQYVLSQVLRVDPEMVACERRGRALGQRSGRGRRTHTDTQIVRTSAHAVCHICMGCTSHVTAPRMLT